MTFLPMRINDLEWQVMATLTILDDYIQLQQYFLTDDELFFWAHVALLLEEEFVASQLPKKTRVDSTFTQDLNSRESQ